MKSSTYDEEFKKSIESLYKKKDDTDTYHYDELVYLVFNTESGKKLLELFKHYFLEAPVAPLNMPPRYADRREGENDFIRNALMGAIDRYNNRRKSNG